VAEYLENHATPPAAVILVDTLAPKNGVAHWLPFILTDSMTDRMEFMSFDQTALTAMAWYVNLFQEWTPTKIATPTLLVKATQLPPGAAGRVSLDDIEEIANIAGTVVEVPGDHFTIMQVQAKTTAESITDWLHNTASSS